MGMAHRGRLAFIAHVVGRPAESILAEFEGHMAFESGEEDMRETAGDVKYHLGAEGTYMTRSGRAGARQAGRQPQPPGAGQRGRRGPHPRACQTIPHERARRATTPPPRCRC